MCHLEKCIQRVQQSETPFNSTYDGIDADLTNTIDKHGTKIQCVIKDCDKESVTEWISNFKDETWYIC